MMANSFSFVSKDRSTIRGGATTTRVGRYGNFNDATSSGLSFLPWEATKCSQLTLAWTDSTAVFMADFVHPLFEYAFSSQRQAVVYTLNGILDPIDYYSPEQRSSTPLSYNNTPKHCL